MGTVPEQGGIELLYSLSKSFTSTAIGMAPAEGLLSIDDAVIGFFPDKVPPGATSGLADLKVRHLLAMASGHAKDTWSALAEGGPDIVRTFLSIPPDHEPGSYFCYNQGCTYTLSAIITRVTGQRLVDYLRPRLFDPLGIEQAHWVQTKEGIDQGFSGLHLTTESVAKLGQLYLQNGFWGGDQLVPESYVAQAHSKQVDNSHPAGSPDWQQGYGFQFWVCRHRAYRGDGAFGQFCIVVPEAARSLPALHRLKTCRLRSTSSGSTSSRRYPALPRATWRRRSGWRSACSACQLPPLVPRAWRAWARGRVQTSRGAGAPHRPVSRLRGGVGPGPDGARLTVVIDGVEHPFDLRPGQWMEGQLPGFRLLPPVAVAGGWTADDEFRADVVFLRSPHRLQLRAKTVPEPTVEANWYTTPL